MNAATERTLRAQYEVALAKAQQAERSVQWPTNADIRRINRLWGKARKAADMLAEVR